LAQSYRRGAREVTSVPVSGRCRRAGAAVRLPEPLNS
jgi:hypothetical protein